jgi:hypothetical protein
MLAALAVALLSAPQAGAAPSCAVTATGKHTRAQTLAVTLSSGCPTTGTQTGRLRYTQVPGISVLGGFTLNYRTKLLTLTLPKAVWANAAYGAMHTDPQTVIRVAALPKRQVFGAGTVTITGGFRAANGARVSWTQTVSVSSTRIQLGGIRISASFPGGRSMLVQVRMVKSYCSQEACPFGATTGTQSFTFPKTFTHATMSSTTFFQNGTGLLSVRETPTILLRDRLSGKVLGRSDYLAIIRAS